jgi:hypothetical protein
MHVIRYHGLYLSSFDNETFTRNALKAQFFQTEGHARAIAGILSWHSTPDINYRDLKVETLDLSDPRQ